ncbi:hypothetical protein ANCCAN_01882 [Ancylostoma caninum]|uniref:Uncharacterized protein n=1 Tax=Ancylostoma caninum TaxID=29170 RepID=A0A368H6A2_ANCCA|nr:hypothetical protein ANCCAN_01882 [Ancylostoma caninum]
MFRFYRSQPPTTSCSDPPAKMTDSAAASETKVSSSSCQMATEQNPTKSRRPSGPNDLARFRRNNKAQLDTVFKEAKKDVISEEEGSDENEYEPERSDATKQELKQRLSRTSVSSDVDIDRIVKESKTTTITETRETIHFRPREGKNTRRDASSSSLEVPLRKRLSILDSSTDEKRPQREISPSTSRYYYRYFFRRIFEDCIDLLVENFINRTQSVRPYNKATVSDKGEQGPASDNVDGLAADYANLEKELKDINDKNKELRKRFFDEKSETPIMSSTSSLPPISARIQEWDSMSIRSAETSRREKKKCTFATPSQSAGQESSTMDRRTSPSTSKQNDCSFNFIK